MLQPHTAMRKFKALRRCRHGINANGLQHSEERISRRLARKRLCVQRSYRYCVDAVLNVAPAQFCPAFLLRLESIAIGCEVDLNKSSYMD